jgi:predicted amidohydrolase
VKVAAVALNAVLADVTTNLLESESYIRQAAKAGAKLIVLPEFFTSAVSFFEKMLDVAIDDRQVRGWLRQLAAECGVIIGGSYIAFDGENAFNQFDLVFPDGEIFVHKKDIPTQFENCYYTNGDENNILVTPIGTIGVALCWEMIRYDTLRRIAGKVDLILSGSCWWDLPIDAPPERESLRQYNQSLAQEAPVTLAKLSGVPVVHANHCGKIQAYRFPEADKIQTRQFVGAAQIADGSGQVLASRRFSEGGGFVLSDLSWAADRRKAAHAIPSRYWIPDLPDSYIHAWETANPIGKHYYETAALPYYKAHTKQARD